MWMAFTPPTRASCPTREKLEEISYDEMLELAEPRREGDAVALGGICEKIRRRV